MCKNSNCQVGYVKKQSRPITRLLISTVNEKLSEWQGLTESNESIKRDCRLSLPYIAVFLSADKSEKVRASFHLKGFDELIPQPVHSCLCEILSVCICIFQEHIVFGIVTPHLRLQT